MTGGEALFLPMSAGGGLDTEWKCPECEHVELGKFDFPLGEGVCSKSHPKRRLFRYRKHG